MADSTAEARQELERARRRADAELDELGATTRSALDIPAKIRRNPVKTAGLAGALAFLLVGGPKRIVRAIERRFFPSRTERLESILPRDVARAVDRLGDNADAVRRNLERDFLRYLEREHPEEVHTGRRSFWKTYDIFIGIVGGTLMRELVKKLLAVPKELRVQQSGERPAVDDVPRPAKIEG